MVNKYFNRVSVSNASFPSPSSPDISTGFPGSISLINEGTGIVEYSFDSINLQGDLVPGTGSQEVVFEDTGLNVIWFRLKSGPVSNVRVEASDGGLEVGSASGSGGSVTVSNFPNPQNVSVTSSLPAGTNQIGHVITDSGSTVVVSNLPTTQAVSGTVTANIGTTGALALDATLTAGTQKTQISSALPAGTNVLGHIITDTGSTVAISNFPATQPISGTITANIGTTNGLALDTSITSLSAKFGSLGQKTMTGSAPVVIASDQGSIPVSGTTTAAYAYGVVPASVWLKNVFGSLPAAGLAIKSSAGILRYIQLINNTGAVTNMQFYDRTTQPTAGSVPVLVVNVASAAVAQFTTMEGGLPFSTGIYLVLSSTLATYTAIASTAATGIVVYA